jgi:hypothetical protein
LDVENTAKELTLLSSALNNPNSGSFNPITGVPNSTQPPAFVGKLE